MSLAPIGVSTYKRKSHLKRTLENLAANKLAKESELYIFSDHPRPGDEQAVAEVRQLIKDVRGFKRVHVVERETNDRAFNNRAGMRSLLDVYGKMIFLEEDVLTSPEFLGFINEGLSLYEEDESVFSICGYSPPVRINSNCDIYLSRRFTAWGFGIWRNRYDRIRRDHISLSEMNPAQLKRLRLGGEDLVCNVVKETNGTQDALDVKIGFTMALEDSYVICPSKSFTSNIGFDGTGTHCIRSTDYFDSDITKARKINWPKQKPSLDKKIQRDIYFFWSRVKYNVKNNLFYILNKNKNLVNIHNQELRNTAHFVDINL